MRVLIVDDCRDSSDSLAELIRYFGFAAIPVYSADEALAAAERHAPQLVLCDLVMPGVDGFALGGRLRKLLPRARIVAVSGYGGPEVRRRVRQAGFDLYLMKPVPPERLQSIVRETATLARSSAASVFPLEVAVRTDDGVVESWSWEFVTEELIGFLAYREPEVCFVCCRCAGGFTVSHARSGEAVGITFRNGKPHATCPVCSAAPSAVAAAAATGVTEGIETPGAGM